MIINRRDWILGSLGAAAWSLVASAQEHARCAVARQGASGFASFDAVTANDIAAIAAQIIPSDDGPGATEAGAVYFIDRALQTFAADQQGAYHAGLADLQSRRQKMFPESASFAALSKEQQFQLLKSIETTDFFGLLRTHTILAWLGPPEYGGNRNHVGWKYIGFDDAGTFDPPFGYYDAEAK
jgi:gluconate 2-dehydrogenase gamma chain